MSSRDPYDDRYEDGDRDQDRGRADDPDAYDDVRDNARGSGPDRLRKRARQRVSLPGLFLIIFGLVSLALAVLNVTLLWLAPDVVLEGQYKFIQDFNKGQPMPPYEEFVKSQQQQGTIIGVFQLVGSLFMALGGMKMRSLDGWGLALAGSVMAIIPVCTNQCCCTSMPFGIWALVVLLNADVKRAFSLVSRPESY
jgi:hypothetical protein